MNITKKYSDDIINSWIIDNEKIFHGYSKDDIKKMRFFKTDLRDFYGDDCFLIESLVYQYFLKETMLIIE